MCSLFLIVYLMKTSLWLRCLVPPHTPRFASLALCADTEGEMAGSVAFWKLSSCQSGRDIFTMLPRAHLLCPQPPCKPCRLLPTRSPRSSQRDIVVATSTCNRQTSKQVTSILSSHLLFHLSLFHIAQSNQHQAGIYANAIKNKPFSCVFGKVFFTFQSKISILATLYWSYWHQ